VKAETLAKRLVKSLDDMKAFDIRVLDVRGQTTITDIMIIASGRSDRQVKALAEKAIETARRARVRPLGTEGERDGEWVLVDLGDVIVHVMHPTARAYYQLEKLWEQPPEKVKAKPARKR
jgi:ribosome-associated protein